MIFYVFWVKIEFWLRFCILKITLYIESGSVLGVLTLYDFGVSGFQNPFKCFQKKPERIKRYQVLFFFFIIQTLRRGIRILWSSLKTLEYVS